MIFKGIATLAAVAAIQGHPNLTNASRAIVFDDVNVVPMDHEVILPGQRVVVVGGSITAMGPANVVETPRGATVIPGNGRYLMPGLVDFHAHPQAPEELTIDLEAGVTTVVGFDGEAIEWRRLGLRPPAPAAHIMST